MIETPDAFLARTGRRYEPPPWLARLGAPLGPGEACPPLFRYPGPCGLTDLFGDRMMHLGPPRADAVWLTSSTWHSWGKGARLFGTVAVLHPLEFDPVHADGVFDVVAADGSASPVFAGLNRPVADPDELVWLPPSQLFVPHPWEAITSPGQARRLFGPGYASERDQVADQLGAYMEELSLLRATGAMGPSRPWCEVPPDERRRTLSDLAVRGRWTEMVPIAV